jgi:hypothetical protein
VPSVSEIVVTQTVTIAVLSVARQNCVVTQAP